MSSRQITRREVQDAIDLHESMKNAYFWSPPSSTSARRSYEKKRSLHSFFTALGHEYEIKLKTTCSCRNVYYHGKIWVDGVKKDVRALKSLEKKLRFKESVEGGV